MLNGIVLIEHFKEVKASGKFESLNDLIKEGAKDRLRAVLLTASAAALGFLPMAISTNAGAEVQRPLATVVIGGLITATILTLVVLPVLYSYLSSSMEKKNGNHSIQANLGLVLLFIFSSVGLHAQDTPKNLDELVPLAIENNAGLKANQLQLDRSDALLNSAFDFDKTDVYYAYDENNLALNNLPIKVFGVAQTFDFPTVYFSRRRVNKELYNLAKSNFDIQSKNLERAVVAGYYEYQVAREMADVFKILDSLYGNFSKMATRRFELGETNYLEKITATSKQRQIQLKYTEAQQNVEIAHKNLMMVIQAKDSLSIANETLLKVPLKDVVLDASPEIAYYRNQIGLRKAEKNLESQQLLPNIGVEYFQGTNEGISGNLHGYQLGLKIPLFFGGKASKIKSAKIAEQSAQAAYTNYEIELGTKLATLKNQLEVLSKSLEYYENEGGHLSDEILKMANFSFQNGEIDFYQYIQSLESAYDVKLEYLTKLKEYNATVVAINYLTL